MGINKNISKKVVAIVVITVLAVLSFFIIKPFISAILFGMVLAFIFYKPYKYLNKLIKKPGLSSVIICIFVILIFAFVAYFMAQITIREAFNLYMSIQKLDVFDIINNVFVRIFPGSPELVGQITITLQQALMSLTNTFINEVGKILTNAPQIFLHLFITFFVMFYFLKEGDKIPGYVHEILPFEPKVNNRFIKRSREVAYATIYGQIIVGIIQGVITGIGFYVFGAPSPLFFTILAVILAVLPFVGSWLVWVPVSLLMIASGNITGGILLIIFGVIVVSTIDDILRPIIVSKRGSINPLVVLIGMLGGLVLLGPIGLIIGPIILEYFIIFIDLYKTGKIKAVV